MKDTKDVVCFCHDNGLFVETASRLAREFKKVYYCNPGWINAFPKMNSAYIGFGLDNIEVVDGPWEVYDDIDLWFFPDVYFGPMQVWLEKQGKYVWGSRMGEEMELYRDAMKEHQKNLRLPLNKWTKVVGIANLRSYLKEHTNVWIKINKWRGIVETFKSKNYKQVEPVLDEMEYKLGAFKTIINFIIEEDVPDSIEVGVDCYTVDGQFPSQHLAGIEVKDLSYIGIFGPRSNLPKQVTDFDNAVSNTFRNYGYKGFYSTEIRVDEKTRKGVMIDFCARQGSPPSEIYQELYANLGEIIWAGSHGIMVDPKSLAKYGVEMLIHSSWADKNWQEIGFPEKYRNNVKLRNACKIDGKYYAIPQSQGLPEIGAVVGWGDTLDSAIKMCKDIADQVEGYYVQTFPESLDSAQEEMNKLDKIDCNFFKQ